MRECGKSYRFLIYFQSQILNLICSGIFISFWQTFLGEVLLCSCRDFTRQQADQECGGSLGKNLSPPFLIPRAGLVTQKLNASKRARPLFSFKKWFPVRIFYRIWASLQIIFRGSKNSRGSNFLLGKTRRKRLSVNDREFCLKHF